MPPNILIILTDQHSPHFMGCAGNDIVRTPNLDRLAAEGMRFTNAYCAAPVCCPSRMSFMTGRTPTRNRVWSNPQLLASDIPTWAHALGIAGYETSLIGRMHFYGRDQYHGFENRPCGELPAVHPGVPSGATKYPTGQSRHAVETAGHGTTNYQWMDDRITEAAVQYLNDHRNADRPFAAVVGYVLPHCPFVAPRDLFDDYMQRVDVPEVEAEHPPMIEWYRKSRKIDDPPLPAERVRIARAAYYALCEYIDRRIGEVLDAVDDDTLVIYTSDHGEMAGDHGCWTKSTYYEGSVGIPMIARWPGVTPQGATCDAVCNLMDLGATVADVAGAESVPDWDSRSLAPFLRGESPDDWQNETFSELADGNCISRMVRSGPWKLWVHQEQPGGDMPVTLFNLDDDPGELRDRGNDPACADVRDRLLARVMDGWDPQYVRETSLAAKRDYKFVSQWGAALRPTLPETMPAPPADLEDDVVIV